MCRSNLCHVRDIVKGCVPRNTLTPCNAGLTGRGRNLGGIWFFECSMSMILETKLLEVYNTLINCDCGTGNTDGLLRENSACRSSSCKNTGHHSKLQIICSTCEKTESSLLDSLSISLSILSQVAFNTETTCGISDPLWTQQFPT